MINPYTCFNILPFVSSSLFRFYRSGLLKMKYLNFLSLSFCILSLAACQTWDSVVEDIGNLEIPSIISPSASDPRSEAFVISSNCPTVEIVEELSMINEYIDISDPQSYNLVSSANLMQAESSCSYSGKSATVDIKLAFESRIGMRGRLKDKDRPFFSYPFFVAVTSPDGSILAKEIFSASVTHSSGQNSQTYYESMRQIIPIIDPARGSRYKVLIGFQLSQDQLNQNRAALRKQKKTAKTAKKSTKDKQEIIVPNTHQTSSTLLQKEKTTTPLDITTPIEK